MKHFFAAAAVFCLSLAWGCSAVIQELPREKLSAECVAPEHRLCRDLLLCYLKNDASGFCSYLSPELRSEFKKEQFTSSRQAMLKTLGTPVSFKFVTELEFLTFRPLIWKIRFERKDKSGKLIHSEALFRIITGRTKEGGILILGFNFI